MPSRSNGSFLSLPVKRENEKGRMQSGALHVRLPHPYDVEHAIVDMFGPRWSSIARAASKQLSGLNFFSTSLV